MRSQTVTRMAMLVCAVWLLGVGLSHAGTPEEEYRQFIQVPQTLQPLGKNPFGEQINLYDGSLSFVVTDINLRGNGLPLQLVRSYKIANSSADSYQQNTLLAGWTLEVPRLTTLVARRSANLAGPGWVVDSTNPQARCSQFFIPPDIVPTDGSDWSSDEWWTGVQMLVPGQGSQTVLQRSPQNTQAPQMSGMSFPLTTNQGWQISCLAATDNGEPGEAFLAIAPDGTRYTFNHLVYLYADSAMRLWPVGINAAMRAQTATVQPMQPVHGGTTLLRNEADMLVTQVQDRFGNTLTYHYNGANLTSITASDGRQMTLQYNADGSAVQTATAVATDGTSRTWTYIRGASGTTDPSKVILPDGSAWVYITNSYAPEYVTGTTSCDDIGTVQNGGWNATFTHPSGLTATFQMAAAIRGRSYVQRACLESPTDAALSYAEMPRVYYQFELQNVTYAGVGLSSNETWHYSYSAPNASWTSDSCAGTQSCPSTVYTDVTDPGGNVTRSTFSNRFDASEGKLLRTDNYAGATVSGTPLRSELLSYAPATGGPWPVNYGWDYTGRTNPATTAAVSPLSNRAITQDGQTYTWQALAFDAYAQPTHVKRYNNIPGQSPIEETTSYLNDTTLWVLGLPLAVTNVGTGEVETSNTYNGQDLLATRTRFGQTLMSYTWYDTGVQTAGQLASFTDGNSHTTSLSNYYRGIPRLISYPDSSGELLAVDDLGQVTAITNQAGRTTGYQYDSIGRLTEIDYPYDSSVDSAQWYPKKFAYAYAPSAERGLGAGHWRRTMTQGNYTDTTYFDAKLRPVLNDTSTGAADSDINISYNYDWRGSTTFQSYPVGGTPTLQSAWTGTRSTYDALGRLHQTLQDSELGTLTTTTQYLPGPGTEVTDPKNHVTTTYYQAFDQPTYEAPWLVSAPAGVSQGIERNIYGEPTEITQSGTYNGQAVSLSKFLTYDSYHRLCRTTEPETGSTVLSYDGANNVAWSADGLNITGSGCGQEQVPAAAQTVRSYDPMNRVLTVSPPSGTQSTSYTYDALGRLTWEVSGIAVWNGTYNTRDQLIAEVLHLPLSVSPLAVGYAYDAYDHLTAVSYPAGAGTSEGVAYAPDSRGLATQVGGYATGIGYFPNGQVESFTYGNGRSYLAQQNARQLTRNFSNGTGSTLDVSEDLTYDADANITAVNDLTGGLRSKSFGYDDLNRLTDATATNLYGTESYTYDPLNNLRSRLTGGQTLAYNYDASNKLASITNGGSTVASFGYDARGNATSDNDITLSFDAKNQLTQIPGHESYAYDGEGRRVEKLPASGSPTYYFYSRAGQLMYQYAPDTATATNFIYLGTKLIARHDHLQLAQPGAISFNPSPSNGSVTISWGAAPAAVSYTLEVSANGGIWTSVYAGTATQTTQNGLAGGSYVYRVQACASGSCSGWTTSATLGVRPAIPSVSVPTGTINGPYTVSWTAAAGATGYTVQESLNGGLWNIIATNTTATSINRPGTTTGSYTYQVQSSDAYGTAGWSATSAAVSVNTNYGVMPSPVPTLSVPTASSTGGTTVTWTAASPITGYTLQQSSDGGTSWWIVYSGTATSAAITGLANGDYTYQVQACNDTAGNSVCTAWVRGGTLVVTHPPASAPGGFTAPSTSSNGSYVVNWNGVATATSYLLQESVNGGGWTTVQSNASGSWSTSGRGNGSYSYRVQACNVGGCGPWSGTVTVTVLWPPASAPSLSVPASSGIGMYVVNWDAVDTATSYNLQESFNGGAWYPEQPNGPTSWGVAGQTTGSYTYRVQACNASGCGPWSATATITVTLTPSTPTGLTATLYSEFFPDTRPPKTVYSLTASWTGAFAPTTYNFKYCQQSGSCYTQSTTATSIPEFYVTGATTSVAIQACNSNGCSAWSASQAPTVVQR